MSMDTHGYRPIHAPGGRLGLTVLGSGGPFLTPRRASSCYVVWLDGQPRLLLDAGSGAFVRAGQAGLNLAALETVLLTHTHIDHTGGLAGLVFAAYMQGRTTLLSVVGPSGRDGQPGCRRFVDLLFGEDGAWSYLQTFEGFGIDASEAPSPLPGEPTVVLQRGDLTVRSVATPHGMMPAVAYRIDDGGASLVYSGDVSGRAPGFVELARGCDVLLHDQAVPERDVRESHLHTKPSVTAGIARDAGCRTLVLTHIMPYLDGELDDVVATVRETYHGEVVVAEDVMTIPVSRDAASY